MFIKVLFSEYYRFQIFWKPVSIMTEKIWITNMLLTKIRC